MAATWRHRRRELPGEAVRLPSWAEIEEHPVADLVPRSPAAELAAVLQRSRRELDAAARAGAEGRAQGLRALAEQAVLAIELEGVLDSCARRRDERAAEDLHASVRSLTERMLAHIAATGLEVVRLRGRNARAVLDLVEVDSWCYDDSYVGEVVIDELEVAIRLDGRPLRLGRVVIGAPHNAAYDPANQAGPVSAAPPPGPSSGRIRCPVDGCGAESEPGAEVCGACLTQLDGYIRLSLYPQSLFDRGLHAARAGDSATARDCFAAVVLWQPDDLRARNAYALACLQARDTAAARRAWENILSHAPGNSLALRGLAALPRGTRSDSR